MKKQTAADRRSVVVTTRISPYYNARLVKWARDRGVTRSDLSRLLLEGAIQKWGGK